MLNVDIIRRQGTFTLRARFNVAAAGVTALFGPSGCGKTTTIQCIAGLLAPDGGRIELDGVCFYDAAARAQVKAEHRGVGYVFQDARLFPHLSVRGNLHYGAQRSRRAVYASFDDLVAMLELGTLLERRPNQLSGGERQRVAIGRALLAQPRLLLLDEPLASLDAARRDEVLPYLTRLRDQLAIPMVYVSHQFDEVLRLATALVLMRAGEVLDQGTLTELSGRESLRTLAGADRVGAVIEAELLGHDESGLLRLRVGAGELRIPADEPWARGTLRLHLLARDVIIATEPAISLSVRNQIAGRIESIGREAGGSDLVAIDIGANQHVFARITPAATQALQLHPGKPVWAMIKAAAIQGHSFAAPARRREL